MMRVNFGEFKNREIIIGKNQQMRPTQSIAKSVIFNVLKITPDDLVLDLFAGTGALGFEAASLGASKVIWFDNNALSVNAIRATIKKFNLPVNNFVCYRTDFRQGLKNLPFIPTIIFLDPPFIARKYYEDALNLFVKKNIINLRTVIIIEKQLDFNWKFPILDYFIISKIKKIGNKEVLFLTLKIDQELR